MSSSTSKLSKPAEGTAVRVRPSVRRSSRRREQNRAEDQKTNEWEGARSVGPAIWHILLRGALHSLSQSQMAVRAGERGRERERGRVLWELKQSDYVLKERTSERREKEVELGRRRRRRISLSRRANGRGARRARFLSVLAREVPKALNSAPIDRFGFKIFC